jgi:hypothetical protein
MTKEERDAYFEKVKTGSAADHKKMMDLLGIASSRQGANGNDPNAPNAANYDEAKANPYPDLPDALLLKNGKKVTSSKLWWSKRRPEIIEEFDREIYGRLPDKIPSVRGKSPANQTRPLRVSR